MHQATGDESPGSLLPPPPLPDGSNSPNSPNSPNSSDSPGSFVVPATRHVARWVAPAMTLGAVAGGCLAIAAWNPTDTGPTVCWSQAVFGVDCPFCGGLRCVNSLMHGDWLAAADHNVVLAVALPIIALALVVWLVRSIQDRPMPTLWPTSARGSLVLGIAAIVFLVAFTVVRNVDGSPWMEYLHSNVYVT